MGDITRRQLLAGAVGLGAPALVLGCSDDFAGAPNANGRSDAGLDALIDASLGDASSGCADPFAGGTLLGRVDFDEDTAPLDVATGDGLNGRLYTDLSKLEPNDPSTLLVANERHYIRTRYPDLIDPNAPWKIAVNGLVKTPLDVTLDMLAPKVKKDLGPFVMECSGNGSFAGFGMLSAARWSGVPLQDVLAMVELEPTAKRVLVSGFDQYSQPQPSNSTPGASWIFTFDQLTSAGAILATEMNGVALPKDHGFPVRLLVPNWYGCTNIKWVDTITLVDDDAQATSQMQEYASRTHQTGTPALARDYVAATIDQAAMPIRIEKWRTAAGAILYRVVGVMWGGYRVTDKLMIRFTTTDEGQRVDVCPPQTTNATWTLWTYAWRPTQVGQYSITMKIDDPTIPTKRLDLGFYRRRATITEV